MDERKLVAVALIGGLVALILFFVLISGGIVRHVPITWQEKIETTIAFKTIDGHLNVIGIIGNSGTNPTLLMRTKDFPMVLTVINQDSIPHMLYIDGLAVHTKILKGEKIKQLHFTHQQKAHTITMTGCPRQLNPHRHAYDFLIFPAYFSCSL